MRDTAWTSENLLGCYQTLITDRLHAHILALLMGKRHVVLDSSYGKIRHTYNAWTHDFEEAVFLDDERQIDTQIGRWLAMEGSAVAGKP